MMKIATIKHNEHETRIGIYFANKTLYYKEDGKYMPIEPTEGYVTSSNYADVCRQTWPAVWDLRFEEIQNEEKSTRAKLKQSIYFDTSDWQEAKTLLEKREGMSEFVRTAIKHEIERRRSEGK